MENNKCLVALAGNPNVGKSTVFNALTGMNQHTGNWAGKTVSSAEGFFEYKDMKFTLADTAGMYSLRNNSAEETSASDFICFSEPDAVIVVCDATCLERNLNLVLQVIEVSRKTIVCVNLLDEAEAKGIEINLELLSKLLGVSVVGVTARDGKGLDELLECLYTCIKNGSENTSPDFPLADEVKNAVSEICQIIGNDIHKLPPELVAMRMLENNTDFLEKAEKYEESDFSKFSEIESIKSSLNEKGFTDEKISDMIISTTIQKASEITDQTVSYKKSSPYVRDRKLDRIFLSRRFGIPVMIILLGVILWITIVGANYPSDLLGNLLFGLGDIMSDGLEKINSPQWLDGILIQGIYKVLAWVISVMLPPMAIFFPMFTLLEDFGYLPRIAFNLDHSFRCANACGKQAITMAMGFGCNACGVTGCRIIDSPHERLIAILTNNFVPCNGRFPTIIMIITMFFVTSGSIISAVILLGVIILGVIMTLVMSKILSCTILKGVASSFTLELPPYRKPQFTKVLVRSIFDRTIFVLARACVSAVPCGLLIWIFANVHVNNVTILSAVSDFLDPFANFMGLDGVILLAFILGFPANEIVFPIILMTYLAQGSLVEMSDTVQLHALLTEHGWNITTALCMMIFTLFHFPCATTCLTIKKETGSLKWTAISFALPTVTGIMLCMVVNAVSMLF
ncbi:MAG: ferrous iron transport protein B [Ruminococcus flavefaciens]|nr:ferrous iron transport protein B [Ruminococcus flavefaciens]